MINGLHQVALGAKDLDESARWFSEVLGLKQIARFDSPGLAFFDLGETRLLIERGAPASLCYFRVENIHASYAALQARGVCFTSEPHVIYQDEQGLFGPAGETEWMAFFEDPAGNTLALAARMST